MIKKYLVLLALSLLMAACSAKKETDLPTLAPIAQLPPTPLVTASKTSIPVVMDSPSPPKTEEAVSTLITPTITISISGAESPALQVSPTSQGSNPTPTSDAGGTKTSTPISPTPSGTSFAVNSPTPILATATPTIPTSTPVPTTPAPSPTSPPPPTTAPTFSIVPPSPPVGPAAPWVYETTLTINTYGFESGFQATQPDDPIYPYPRLDFSRVGSPVPRTYKAIVMENGYISIMILPELGGRIYSWIDKATGRHLLYENRVIKPTSWGYRGWWLSAGGIEWAFPVDEHGLNEWRPWSYAINGASVTVSNIEDRTGMEVGATISLDTGHAYITIQPWARNNTAVSHQYQLWLNAMLTLGNNNVSGQTQFIIPANQVTVHSTGDGGVPGPGGSLNWPVHGGRDMSWYSNWGGYLGFFAPSNGFVGLYDHGVDQGIVRAHAPGWPAGTKFFGPAGLSPSIWTDDGSSYVELWSGATYSFWNYTTLEPGASVGWQERWYPVSQIGGFTYANVAAALRLTESGGNIEIGVAVSAATTGSVNLWMGGQRVSNWPVTLFPGQALRATWTRPSGNTGALGLRLVNNNGTVLAQTGQVP